MTYPLVHLRRIAAFAYGDSMADSMRQDGGVPVYGSNGRVGWHDVANAHGPAVVIGRKGSFGKVQFSDEPLFAIDTTFYVDDRYTRADLRWLYYALQTLRLDELSEDVGVPGLSRERAYSQRVALPPLDEQRAIADYLDRETARIDALIAAKERMAALVEDRLATKTRVRLMAAAEHVTTPLKRTWRIIDCKHVTPTYVPSGFPVVSPGDATPGRLDLRGPHRFVTERDFKRLTENGRRPKRGDIIYSRNASIGIASYVDTDQPFCMGQDVCLITSAKADQLFLTYFLNTLGLDQLEELKVGSTFSRVNIAQIAELSVPTPCLEVQRRVAQVIDESRRAGMRVNAQLHAQIGLLRERRQTLITAAVTGQLEIPVAA